ncbi:methyltransferase domain-containing protein, partial [bacterium]|nr:methyltransferase domain-containing protein [bacterium]
MSGARPDLQAHYGRPGLLEAIDAALAAGAGEGVSATAAADLLARIDEFHPGGRAATDELARLARPRPGERALDLGCGIGGPARRLRRLVGPGGAVTGVDVDGEYCRVARALAARAADTADIAFVEADVATLELPGPRFDLVWSQQAQMNAPDKAAWAGAVARHLRAGGRYACAEFFAGPAAADAAFPVPWAREAAGSHVVTPERWLAALAEAGLDAVTWSDVTAATIAWLDEAVAAQKALAAAGDPAAAVSVRLLLGPDAALMSRNLRANLAAGG